MVARGRALPQQLDALAEAAAAQGLELRWFSEGHRTMESSPQLACAPLPL